MVGKMKRRLGEEGVRLRGPRAGVGGNKRKGRRGQAQQRMSLAGACMCKGDLGRIGSASVGSAVEYPPREV